MKLHVCAVPEGISFEVTDNGQGIPRTEHRRIFDKFYRIDDRLSREREGSGLGLAIVKHVARAHQGRVQLVSAKGQGSTFRLIVPAAPPAPAKPASDPAATTPEAKRA